MSTPPPVAFAIDDDRVGWIVFDAPGVRANVFNPATQEALEVALASAEAGNVQALVVCGQKDRIFIAGADLHWLQSLTDIESAIAFSRHGQRLFRRLADSRIPIVCAIHGACAGGGFELALACDWRIASDSPATQIGLPETSIGTIPGWGGSVRLPRLIGAEAALDHILRAQLVSAAEALKLGLVDELSPAAETKERAKAAALRLARSGRPARATHAPVAPQFFEQARHATLAKTHGHQPALLAAIDAVAQGQAAAEADAFENEARCFGQVTAGRECKNLIHVFFLREAAKKRTLEGWFEPETETTLPPIHRIGVVGAGVMGSGIAHWLATRGFDVVLRDVRLEFVERAMDVIRGLLAESVQRGKTSAEDAAVVFGRIRTTTEWDGFAACDLVIEAIVENVAAKQQLFAELAAVVRPDALLASNTSALPIEEIAGHVPNPGRTLGIHFFNPVSRMPLVELIVGPRTSRAAAERALALVRTLGKSPVICRSSAGFVVTRVLFFYLNAAVRLWESGVETPAIDAAMREFGWPMGPMRLIDEVGIDVTAFIFTEMAQYYPGRFVATAACDALLKAGFAGRKNGAGRGFYGYAGAKETANDAETRRVVSAAAPVHPTMEAIVERLMRVMVDEARRCVAERVVLSPDDVDFAFLAGAGFPAFRGGLLRWAEGKHA